MVTYNFFVIVLQTTHHKVHLLVILSQLSSGGLLSSNVLLMMLESGTLKIERTVVVVNNFEQGFVVSLGRIRSNLLLE